MRIEPSFLFDLDGTLVDSVYQHVLAWKATLDAEKIELSVWRIHRKIGMSGGLFTNQLLRETAVEIDPERVERLQRAHARAYQQYSGQISPHPARASCSLGSPKYEFPGLSLPAAGWRRRQPISQRSTSILQTLR